MIFSRNLAENEIQLLPLTAKETTAVVDNGEGIDDASDQAKEKTGQVHEQISMNKVACY